MGRYLRGTVEQRFWHKVDKRGPDECWLWLGVRSSDKYGNKTYGQLWVPTSPDMRAQGRMAKAHRISYALAHDGAISDELQIDHLCLNKGCVNPAHLELVTQAENMRRGPQIERARAWAAAITHCPHGHEYTPENTIRDAGKRKCRICVNERGRRYRREKV